MIEILRPGTIRATKFWTSCSFLMLRLLVLDPRRRAIIEFAENKGTQESNMFHQFIVML